VPLPESPHAGDRTVGVLDRGQAGAEAGLHLEGREPRRHLRMAAARARRIEWHRQLAEAELEELDQQRPLRVDRHARRRNVPARRAAAAIAVSACTSRASPSFSRMSVRNSRAA
jgi:hypothetical protein